SHFAPAQMMQAVELYRATFRPSAQLAKPYVMLGFNVFAAESDEEAKFRATSMQQAFVNLRSGRPSRLPPPVKNYSSHIGPHEQAILDQVLSCAAIGSHDTVAKELLAFISHTGADELMITSQIFDHAARLRSYEITAQVHKQLSLS
ncbi:MAG: LLM class flavin-dependent oxidoreductase, partial [Burkholderiaceae bacterium]